MNRVTLIRSKLLMPNPANLLHRPRVCQVIKRGLERKLTLLSAPAGYGKTSALVDFARRSSVPVCWYTADERDRDLDLFIRYLVEAIHERFAGFGKRTQEALASSDGALSHDPTAVVGELVNEMIDLDAPFAVVVDNYEALDGVFGVRTFVHRLLEVLPFNCHLMFSSRVLPDVPATRLVAKRQLVGLTDQNLRFEPQEIQALLQLSRLDLSQGQAQAIAANSEGWITGVLLLADLLRDGTVLPAKQATAQTYDYLAQEVLRRQPPDVQHFLYTSAVLREMSSSLCREVLQIERPHILLTEVERRNLFVTRFGGNGATTYRYHNLFRDFLHEQLRQRNPIRRAALHLRAAERFERKHDVEEAIYHYLAAGACPEAAALMERAAMEWFTQGRVETLLRWAEALPEESRARTPWLSFYQSRALTDRYDYEGARRALAHAEAGFAEQGDTLRLARTHNQRATLRMYEGRYEDVLAEARVALGMLGQNETIERAEAQRLVGRAYVWLGRLAEGVVKLQDALALFRQFGSPYDVVNLLQDLALAFSAQGNLDGMAACLNEALAVGRRLGSIQLATVLNDLGWLHHRRGEYRKSLALYEEGLSTARRGNDLRSQAYILVGMADLYRDVEVYERAYPLYDTG
jgi:LuxR family maltose regulon positive regulatory protein